MEDMCPIFLATATMNNTYYGDCKSHYTSEIHWEVFYDQSTMDTKINKSQCHWEMFTEVLK